MKPLLILLAAIFVMYGCSKKQNWTCNYHHITKVGDSTISVEDDSQQENGMTKKQIDAFIKDHQYINTSDGRTTTLTINCY